MRIHAFSGTRYATSAEGGSLACPPYDQIDDQLRAQLHRNPHQFAHLIRPDGIDRETHESVARLHHRWLAEGVVAADPQPAIYPYEIELATGGRRLGVCALVRLDSGGETIRPHEATLQKTVDERLSLLRETRIDLEPILMLAQDEGSLNHLVAEDLDHLPVLVEHRDTDGHVHRLYRQADSTRISHYQQQLDGCVGLIADGHHRYAVARRYAGSLAEISGPQAAKLTVLSSIDSPGLRIDPIHRALGIPVDIHRAAGIASDRRALEGLSGAEMAAAVAAAPQPALAVAVAPDRVELWQLEPGSAPADLPDHLRHLAVGWLHEALLTELDLAPTAATDGTVVYRSDPERLLSEVRSGQATVGFWLPPMTGDDFARAMQGGQLLPPKSTRFLPKVVSGLVWAPHDCTIQ